MAIEIDAMLGTQAGGVFQQVGFHPTGVVGVFGASVAAADCMGGIATRWCGAQGVALSLAVAAWRSSMTAVGPSGCIPGWAASCGPTGGRAGCLAALKGPGEAYGGRFGFYALYAPGTVGGDGDTISEQLIHGMGACARLPSSLTPSATLTMRPSMPRSPCANSIHALSPG